jgi:hypothetical protein
MAQVVPIQAAKGQEDDWFRRLVFGIEVPVVATEGIRLPDVLKELDQAQTALERASSALSKLEESQSARALNRAATSAQRTAAEFFGASLSQVERLMQSVDEIAAQVDALQGFASTAGEGLNAARASVLQARDATPDPAYQAALTAADDAILEADAARVELQETAARQAGSLGDDRRSLAGSYEDIRIAAGVAAAEKQLDEPLLDVVRRSRSSVMQGVDARQRAAVTGSAVLESVGEVATPAVDFRTSLAHALERGQEARSRALESGASTTDVDAAIAELGNLNEACADHVRALQVVIDTATDATATTTNRSDEVDALDALADSEALATTSLAAMDFVIPDPQTLLQEALTDVNELVNSLVEINDDIDMAVLLLQEAQEEAQAALNNPPRIPEEDLELYLAAIRAAQQMVYNASDSVTDMQLPLDDEITPSSGEVRDALVAVLNATLAESYTGLPEDWKPIVDRISVAVVDAQLQAEASKMQLFEVGNEVDNGIEAADNQAAQEEQEAAEQANESSGGTTPEKDASKCSYDFKDGVNVYTGDEETNECTGTDGVDIFHMRGNNDTAWGRGGADQIHLSWGYDTAYGEGGPDEEWGGTENDDLLGQFGDDILRDSQDTSLDGDDLWGGPNSDWGDILDGDTADSFFGGKGSDKEPKYDQSVACDPNGNCVTGSDEIDMGD